MGLLCLIGACAFTVAAVDRYEKDDAWSDAVLLRFLAAAVLVIWMRL